MRRLAPVLGVAVGCSIAAPQIAGAQRVGPTPTPTSSIRELPPNDISCAVKVFAKTPSGGEVEVGNNGSTVWSSLMPPRVYAVIFLYNKGLKTSTVKTKVELMEVTEVLGGSTPTGYGVAPAAFVTSLGAPLAVNPFPVSKTIAANGLEILGQYWINNAPRTTMFIVRADADVGKSVVESNEWNNSCSGGFTIIAPAR